MGREQHSPPLNFKPRALPTQVPPAFTLEDTGLQHLEGGKDFSLVLMPPQARVAYLPSNLCLRKSKSAFCIMSVTWVGGAGEGRGVELAGSLLGDGQPPQVRPRSSASPHADLDGWAVGNTPSHCFCGKFGRGNSGVRDLSPHNLSERVPPAPQAAWRVPRHMEEYVPPAELT